MQTHVRRAIISRKMGQTLFHVNAATGHVRLHCHWRLLVIPPFIVGLYLWFSNKKPAALHSDSEKKEVQVLIAKQGLSRHGGGDYPCDASDGPDPRACQIRCGDPCVEPYRLCLAHFECGAIVINPKLTFATLKRLLPQDAAQNSISSSAEWRQWLLANSPLLERAGSGVARPIRVALHRVPRHDFGCADSEGDDLGACQLACRDERHCVRAYYKCISHASCSVVELNAPLFTWATLKTYSGSEGSNEAGGSQQSRSEIDARDYIEVGNASSWHLAFRAAQLAARGFQVGSVTGGLYMLRAAWRDHYASLTERIPSAASRSEIGGRARTVLLATVPVAGHDFDCAEAEGNVTGACQVS